MVTNGDFLHPSYHSLDPGSFQKESVKIEHVQNQLTKCLKIVFLVAFDLQYLLHYELKMVLDDLVVLLIISSHVVVFQGGDSICDIPANFNIHLIFN